MNFSLDHFKRNKLDNKLASSRNVVAMAGSCYKLYAKYCSGFNFDGNPQRGAIRDVKSIVRRASSELLDFYEPT